jgi:hypothetical protein
MPIFNDSENRKPIVEEGDYTLTVVGFEIGISAGGKTAGCEKYDVEFEVDGHGTHVFEVLLDHPTCAWKIDCFLKACGQRLKKGQSFAFRQDEAERNKVLWIDPIGLRCPVRLVQDSYKPKSAGPNDPPRIKNKVAVFYTDRPALPRAVVVAPPAIEDADMPF